MGLSDSRAIRLGPMAVPVILLLAAGLGLSQGHEPDPWPVGRPVPVAVETKQNDEAEFSVPTSSPGSRVLVVVSALGQGRRPYSMKLEATSTNQAAPPRLADDGSSPLPRPVLCPLPAIPPEPFLVPPPVRAFSILCRDGDPASASNYRSVNAHLLALGRRVQVYVDEDDLGRVSPEMLRDIVSTFDTHVFPVAVRRFGPSADVDHDGRFTVLLTGRIDPRADGRLPVDGFVRGSDFDLRVVPPFGNQADMLYLSARLSSGPYLRTVLAHEYTHAVTFSRKAADALAAGQAATDEQGWLDEALAHLVEDLHGFSRENLDYRLSAFLSAPERYRLVVADYYLADLFRSHGNRGATYSFLRWCSEEFGPSLLPTLIRSPLTGIKNLESATGRSFASLYRQWSASVFLDALKPSSKGTPDGLILGPRTTRVKVDGPADVWTSAPTSSHYAIVDASPTGFVHVRVQGAPGSKLQVTFIRLPDDLPGLDLSATVGEGAKGMVSLSVEHLGGAPVHLSALSVEPLVLSARPEASSPSPIQGDSLSSAFDRLDLDDGYPCSSARIPLPESLARLGGPLVVKLLALDSQGRRIAAWAEFNLAPGERAPTSP